MFRAVSAVFVAAILLPATDILQPDRRQMPNAGLGVDLSLPAQDQPKLYEEKYHLRISAVYVQDKGLGVVAIDPNGPGANMLRRGNPATKGILEPKDIITHINGHKITGFDQFHKDLAKVEGKASITVYDPGMRRSVDWNVTAVKAMTPALAPDTAAKDRVIHAVLVGDTEDEKIGKAAQMNIDNIAAILKAEVPDDFLKIYTLTGQRCRTKRIIEEIGAIKSTASDTIFYFHTCHGGYDRRFEKADPSGGHFFQLSDGDLLRKTLFDAIMARPGRLKVLYTESCSGLAVAHPSHIVSEVGKMTAVKARPVEQLLRYHRGYADINAASRDQIAWVSSRVGGWFKYATLNTIQTESEWDTFIHKLSLESSSFYKRMREIAVNKAKGDGLLDRSPFKELLDQLDMNPAIYQMQLTRDTVIEQRPQKELVANRYSVVHPK